MGVRWWLGAAFAVVAALSTAIVVSQYSSRSESALRVNGEQHAIASAYLAAAQINAAQSLTAARVAAAGRRQGLQLAVYDGRGRLTAGRRSTLDARALGTLRYHGSTENGRVFVVGVPLRDGKTLVARDVRPDVQAAIGILNDQALRAGVIAGLIGVAVGLVLAQLIALRLRRLSSAAEIGRAHV